MKKTYKKIITQFDRIGINSKLDGVKVKVIDLENEVLVLDPKTGWLALRRQLISKNDISGENKVTYFNKVMCRSKTKFRCLYPELKDIHTQIVTKWG